MPSTDQLTAHLDRLAAFDGGPFPVLSLYLNAQPNQHGRDHFDTFLRVELADRLRTYPAEAPERQSLEQDHARIAEYLQTIERSANGIAIFACSAARLFEAIQLAAPVTENRLFISPEPHLYPLARLADDYPRYAVLVADTNRARIVVIAANRVQSRKTVENEKTRGHKMGGWSQARYQRRVRNDRAQHAREVVETLTRIVREEGIDAVIVAGDEVVVPLLRAEFPKELGDKVVDIVPLDIRTPEHAIVDATTPLMATKDERDDRARVEALFDAYRGNGLGVVGLGAVRRALEMGQVDELLISGVPEAIDAGAEPQSPLPSDATPQGSPEERAANELIARAQQTGALVTIIQERSLLEPVGGVGALLRFRI